MRRWWWRTRRWWRRRVLDVAILMGHLPHFVVEPRNGPVSAWPRFVVPRQAEWRPTGRARSRARSGGCRPRRSVRCLPMIWGQLSQQLSVSWRHIWRGRAWGGRSGDDDEGRRQRPWRGHRRHPAAHPGGAADDQDAEGGRAGGDGEDPGRVWWATCCCSPAAALHVAAGQSGSGKEPHHHGTTGGRGLRRCRERPGQVSQGHGDYRRCDCTLGIYEDRQTR